MGCAGSSAAVDDGGSGLSIASPNLRVGEGVADIEGALALDGSVTRVATVAAAAAAGGGGGNGDGSAAASPTPILEVQYAARVRAGGGKDQDRYIFVPHGAQALSFGVCDGHSVHDTDAGRRHAAAAAQHLGRDVWRRVAANSLLAPASSDGDPSDALKDAACSSFVDHQKVCEARYGREVADRLLAEKERLEKEIGDELPLELPQEGGTTATLLLAHPHGVLCAWVGGKAGKDAMASHVSVKNAEGTLKVTRSLGDSPFHKSDAVSAVPGVRHVPLSRACKFVVVASDGVWDHLSNEAVVEIVGAQLGLNGSRSSASLLGTAGGGGAANGRGASDDADESSTAASSGGGPPLIQKMRSNSITAANGPAAACDAVLKAVERSQAEGKAHVDDCSIVVASLSLQ